MWYQKNLLLSGLPIMFLNNKKIKPKTKLFGFSNLIYKQTIGDVIALILGWLIIMQVSGGLQWPINKLDGTFLNGNVNQVGTSEDLVACLQNNLISNRDLVVA